jgi:DNA-binding LytR/AlgR family response regulator
MKSLSYILADDEVLYHEVIQQYLEAIPELTCLQVCSSAIEASQCIHQLEPDFLILDVEMPGLTGLQLIKSLSKQPYVIFISSHPNYALDAFEVDAIDFIKKPIPPERLLRAIAKIRTLIELKDTIKHLESVMPHDTDSFFIREEGSYCRIFYKDIQYCESLTDFTKLYLMGGNEKLALVNLKNLLLQLPRDKFVRISRTHIVNTMYITSIRKDEVVLDQLILPLGNTYLESVTEQVVGNNVIKRHAK